MSTTRLYGATMTDGKRLVAVREEDPVIGLRRYLIGWERVTISADGPVPMLSVILRLGKAELGALEALGEALMVVAMDSRGGAKA